MSLMRKTGCLRMFAMDGSFSMLVPMRKLNAWLGFRWSAPRAVAARKAMRSNRCRNTMGEAARSRCIERWRADGYAIFSSSSISASTISASGTFRKTSPRLNTTPEPGTARHAKVGVGGFARTVHNAAHNGDLHRLDAVRKALVDFLREVDEVHLAATACGAAYDFGAAAAQIERSEQHPASAHLFGRFVGERNTHGVADALVQKNTQAASRFNDTLHERACFGDADMQRHLRNFLRERAVGGDGRLHIVRLG